ncbi:helix-turn-helix domain-containing protein [Nocardioides taihuensis]|uniref:Helix-turn-helix domain-containing protein n=1 Tax=Nocardioides taihuensis TaxID=1835606 RepID=A0ABW0BQT9_9ACTN
MTNVSTVHVDHHDDGRHDDHDDHHAPPAPLGLAPEPVEVRRNGGLAALVGAVASAVAIAWLARATSSGSVVDWLVALVMGVIGVVHLAALVDARTPLLVADAQGVRIRLGRSWSGLPWGALSQVEHRPRRSPLHDGRLVLAVRNPERLIEELDPRGRRQARLSRRLYGAPLAVPLALSTRVTGDHGDLTAALTTLAGEQSRVVETETAPVRRPDPRPALARTIAAVSAAGARLPRRRPADDVLPAEQVEDSPAAEPADQADEQPTVVASATPSPLRQPVVALRAEVTSTRAEDDGVDDDATRSGDAGGRELRRPGSVNLVEDTVLWSDRVSPIARPGHAVEPLLIDDLDVEPAEDPVIGPQFLAARTRLGLTVDQLAERTRIRPHVIESIEVDDFAPCGGDFYARGHIRTLGRVLGVDVAPLLTAYDERYADAPINPRRVFEAELASGAGSIRGTRGGPNWSVLVAAVMALVLAWSIARLVMDSPVDLQGNAPVLNGSAGVDNGGVRLADPVPVQLHAAGGGAHVVVRDGANEVVFTGNLAFGETKTMRIAPPVRIQSSDGSLEVTVAGQQEGAIGSTGQPAQDTFVPE